MPSFPWSRAMTANQSDDRPLANWQFRRVPIAWEKAYVSILQRATTTGVRVTIFAGSTTIVQRSPVQAGGTAGTTPAPLNTTPIDFIADGGDEIIISNDEVSAGVPTVDGICNIEREA